MDLEYQSIESTSSHSGGFSRAFTMAVGFSWLAEEEIRVLPLHPGAGQVRNTIHARRSHFREAREVLKGIYVPRRLRIDCGSLDKDREASESNRHSN